VTSPRAKRPGLGSLGGEWGEGKTARLQADLSLNAQSVIVYIEGPDPPHVCHPEPAGVPYPGFHTLSHTPPGCRTFAGDNPKHRSIHTVAPALERFLLRPAAKSPLAFGPNAPALDRTRRVLLLRRSRFTNIQRPRGFCTRARSSDISADAVGIYNDTSVGSRFGPDSERLFGDEGVFSVDRYFVNASSRPRRPTASPNRARSCGSETQGQRVRVVHQRRGRAGENRRQKHR